MPVVPEAHLPLLPVPVVEQAEERQRMLVPLEVPSPYQPAPAALGLVTGLELLAATVAS
jgi:hypothetical protein